MKHLWTLLVVVAAGCASDAAPLSTADAHDAGSFCDRAAELQCHEAYTCLTADERKDLDLPMTQPECVRQIKASCERGFDQCDAGGRAFSPDAAGTCLDDMTAATCNDASQPFLGARSCEQVCAATSGAFAIEWQFSGGYSCASLGIDTVALITDGDGPTNTDLFDCFASTGTTATLPFGAYHVHLELYENGALRWSSTPSAETLDQPTVDLGTITVPVAN